MLADDERFVALHIRSRSIADNAVCTGKAFATGLSLMAGGLKGREVSGKDRKPAQLTFVVDISGSMDRENRLGLVKRSLRLLVDQLRDEDRIGIVVYGSRGHVLLEPTAIGSPPMLRAGEHGYPEDPRDDDWARSRPGRERILAAIDRLQPTENPPGVNGVIDFDEGGRVICELTDCEPDKVEVGMPVEMTYRKMFQSRGINNYFWKAKPI